MVTDFPFNDQKSILRRLRPRNEGIYIYKERNLGINSLRLSFLNSDNFQNLF